jgi:hypothetical protein
VTLNASASSPHLEVVDPSTIPAESALRDSARWSEIGAPKKAKKERALSAIKCLDCGLPLNRSQYSPDRRWKSCPKCSATDGEQHVFLEYPDAFGVSEARETDDSPDGAKSYCVACRTGNPQEHEERLCSTVAAAK